VWILIILGAILMIVGAVLIWTGRRTQRFVNLMRQAAPMTADQIPGAFPGMLIAISGVARSDRPLKSEHGQTPCLYYTSSIEREYETTEYTAATKDKPAQRSTRRVTESVSSNSQFTDFALEDATGRVHVSPEDATFDARSTMNRFEPAASGGTGSISVGSFSINLGDGDRTLGYRYRESVIPVDEPVFVLGVVTETGEIAKPGRNRKDAALVVSHRSEEALREAWGNSARWQAYGAIGSFLVGSVLVIIAILTAIL
jgi:hypothetical protein